MSAPMRKVNQRQLQQKDEPFPYCSSHCGMHSSMQQRDSGSQSAASKRVFATVGCHANEADRGSYCSNFCGMFFFSKLWRSTRLAALMTVSSHGELHPRNVALESSLSDGNGNSECCKRSSKFSAAKDIRHRSSTKQCYAFAAE